MESEFRRKKEDEYKETSSRSFNQGELIEIGCHLDVSNQEKGIMKKFCMIGK